MMRHICGLLLVAILFLAFSLVAGEEEDDFAESRHDEPKGSAERTLTERQVRRIVDEAVREALEKERAVRAVRGEEKKEGSSAEKKPLPADKLILWSSDTNEQYLYFSGYLQSRFSYQNNDANMPPTSLVDVFSLNKARMTFAGKFASWSGFKMELDLWDQKIGDSIVSEAYVDFPIYRYAQIKTGLIKAPLLYQKMMSGSKQLFAEEAMAVRQRTMHIKGFDPSKKTSAFPGSDFGAMVQGDLFPWPELDAFKDWPEGIVRYYVAYQNGFDFKSGSGRNGASMYSLRAEVNPFGYKEYNESHAKFNPDHWPVDWDWHDFTGSIGFNYGKSIDLESAYDVDKDAYFYAIDGFIGFEGLTLGGGWVLLQSAGSKKYEAQTTFDPAWESEGWYLQAGLFIPIPYWVREHVELKFRYEEFDPYKMVGGHRYDTDDVAAFVPQGIGKVMDRKMRTTTFGLNLYFSPGGRKNAVKISFDYHLRDEIENFQPESGSTYPPNAQIRNDSWILQVQFAL